MLIIIIIVWCAKITIFSKDTFHPDKKPVAVKIMHLDYSRLGAQVLSSVQYCTVCMLWFSFILGSNFISHLMYDNELKTKENKI